MLKYLLPVIVLLTISTAKAMPMLTPLSENDSTKPVAPPALLVCPEETNTCSFCVFGKASTDALCYGFDIDLPHKGHWAPDKVYWIDRRAGVLM